MATAFDALPVPEVGEALLAELTKAASAVFNRRNTAVDLIREAEGMLSDAIGQVKPKDSAEQGPRKLNPVDKVGFVVLRQVLSLSEIRFA